MWFSCHTAHCGIGCSEGLGGGTGQEAKGHKLAEGVSPPGPQFLHMENKGHSRNDTWLACTIMTSRSSPLAEHVPRVLGSLA